MKAARIGNFIYIFFFRVFSSSMKLNCPSSLKIVLFELRLEFIVLPLCWISNLDCEIIVHVHSENGDKRGIRVFSFLFLIQRVVYFFFFPPKIKLKLEDKWPRFEVDIGKKKHDKKSEMIFYKKKEKNTIIYKKTIRKIRPWNTLHVYPAQRDNDKLKFQILRKIR